VKAKQISWGRLFRVCIGFTVLLVTANVWCDTVDQFSVTLSSGAVGRYEKLEVICDGITTSYTNPFDPGEVSVEGHFIDPDGVEEVSYGFWYQDYTRSLRYGDEVLTAVGSPQWRVRYAPQKVGNYSCYVRATDLRGTLQSQTKTFTVTTSDKAGFVRVSPQDTRYFQFDNGQQFFGIMLDVCWWDFREKTYSYDYYFSQMQEHGLNFARLWMYNSVDGATEQSWICHIQDRSLGANYDLVDSWRMDYIIEQARQRGIYLMLCFDDVNEFVPGYKWESNLYNSSWPGGFLTGQAAFFTNAQAKSLYKRLLRYMVARWGYSTSVLSWELWNELHELEYSIADYDQPTVNAWHAEMANELRSLDPNDHMVTSSNGSFCPSAQRPGGINYAMPEMSYSQMHAYQFDDGSGWHDLSEIVQSYSKYVTVFGKPAIFGESGIVNSSWLTSQWINPSSTAPRHDSSGMFIHNAIWAGLMSGLASTPPFWDWQYLHNYSAWWDQHRALANFVADVPFTTAGYRVVNNVPDSTVVDNAGFEPGEPAWTFGSKFSIVTSPVHSGVGALSWNSTVGEEMHAAYSFNMSADREYEISGWVRVQGVSGSLRIRLDYDAGVTYNPQWHYYTITIPEGTRDWTRYTLTIRTPAANCRAGYVRCVASYCTGAAWFDDISVKKTDPSIQPTTTGNKLRVLGLRNDTGGLFWIHNLDNAWYEVMVQGQTPPVVSGATMTLPVLQTGDYTVEWWDTYNGVVSGTTDLTTDGSGTLTIALPNIQTDVACKIRQKSSSSDTTPPTTPVISTPSQVVNADTFAVELSTPSTDANFSNYQVKGGQYADWTNTSETGPFIFNLTQNAANTLSVRGRDTYGNLGNAASVVITEDSVLPTTPAIQAPPQMLNADSVTLTLSSPSADANFACYQLRGGQYSIWTDTSETTGFNFTLAQNAANSLQIRGKDRAGNVSSAASVVLTEDSVSPTTPAISTQPQLVNADSITVTLSTPSTDANFSNYQVKGGQYAGWTNTFETTSFAFTLSQNAANELSVRGTDRAGNVSAPASVTITEDSIAPTAPVVAPQAQLVLNADTITVTLSTSSTDTNFSNYQVKGGQYADWTNTFETSSFTFTLNQNATNELSIRGRDKADNVSNPGSVVIVEDSRAPAAPAKPVHTN